MAAPVGPIQVQPAGLLGLLQLKSWGERPDILEGRVQPILDMEAWWLRGSLETLIVSQAPVDVGPIAPGTVWASIMQTDAREWWYVHWINLVYASAVGTNAIPFLGVGFSTLAPTLGAVPDAIFADVGTGIVAPTGVPPGGNLCARGFWVPPGSFLGYYATVVGVGDVAIQCTGLGISRTPI